MFDKFRAYFHRAKTDYVHEFFSPDRRTALTVELRNGVFFYGIHKDKKVIIRPSRLGMLLRGQDPIFSHLTLIRTQEKSFDETWEAPWGEEHHCHGAHCCGYLQGLAPDTFHTAPLCACMDLHNRACRAQLLLFFTTVFKGYGAGEEESFYDLQLTPSATGREL